MSTKRLRRSSNRIIAGVCAGIAEYMGIDVNLVRVLYVIISLVSVAFPGILAYLILWLVVPSRD